MASIIALDVGTDLLVLEQFASRFAGGDPHFLVTEVTRMRGGVVCVAAIDLASQRIVRPLQWNGNNWPDGDAHAGIIRPGTILRQRIRTDQGNPAFPHASEDLRLTDTPAVVEYVANERLYELLLPAVDSGVQAVFPDLIDGQYVVENTRSRSLGSIAGFVRSLGADDFGKIRVQFDDSTGRTYDRPLTDFAVQSPDAAQTLSARVQAFQAAGHRPILRLGLARAWSNNGAYNPPRCYLQVNGVIVPQ